MSDLHPHALSLDEAALDHPDLAHALAADIAAFHPPDIIHRYVVVARQGQAEAALTSNGFSATRLTRLLDLPLDLDLAEGSLPSRLAPHWFAPGERGPWDPWVHAHWRHYQNTHRSNPPHVPPGGLDRVFIGQDLIAGFALREGPQGHVRSFASLRSGQELGWIGGPSDVLAWTLSACLRRAAALGWSHATLEVDDDDVSLWNFTRDLVVPRDHFVTWHLERCPQHHPN